VRYYTDGAVLDEHVDTLATHVISLIINVGQVGMRTDWPLTILDHNHTRHQIIMEPGDMVLYESAKCQHGRPIPMEVRLTSVFVLVMQLFSVILFLH
jgi:predicted 2-oxoglutarate/Fe(II)-dependent dioxygenase YbiX